MNCLRIRCSTPHDVEAIQCIYAHYVTHSPVTFEEVVPDVAEIATRRQAILDAGYPHLVAIQGERVVGYAYGSRYRPRSAYRLTVEDSIYLHPEMLGKGIGTTLLSALIQQCTERGFVQMVAVIGGRAQASIAVHRRCGFRLIGHLARVGLKFGVLHDSSLMERNLTPGTSA